MAEGRKRSRRAGRAPEPPPPPSGSPAPSSSTGSEADQESGPRWVSREESLAFPAQTPVPRSNVIDLPPSGLAEDILARADAAAVAPLPSRHAPAPAEAETAVAARVHNISFFAPPAREEPKPVEATEHLATFFLGQEEYGVDVHMVQEIIRVSEITQVPRAPESIKGVINLRGRIIPVVDLKRKLGLGEMQPSRATRIAVVKVRERLIGLLVDAASQVLKVPISTIEPAPEEVVEIDASYIRGVAKLEKRLIILMDLPRVLAPEFRDEEGPSP